MNNSSEEFVYAATGRGAKAEQENGNAVIPREISQHTYRDATAAKGRYGQPDLGTAFYRPRRDRWA